jgi:hypothetical protein
MIAALSEVKSTQAMSHDLLQSKVEENGEILREMMGMMQDVCIDHRCDCAVLTPRGFSLWPKTKEPLNNDTRGFRRIYGNSNVNLGNFCQIFTLNLVKSCESKSNQRKRQMLWISMKAYI